MALSWALPGQGARRERCVGHTVSPKRMTNARGSVDPQCGAICRVVWAIVAFIGWMAPFGARGEATAAGYRTDRIIVRAAPGADTVALEQLHGRVGPQMLHRFKHAAGGELRRLAHGMSVERAVSEYRAS